MTKYLLIALVFGFLLLLSILPFFQDPYEHRQKMNFWQWSLREILELMHGEK